MNLKKLFLPALTLFMIHMSISSNAAATELQSIDYSSLSNGNLELIFTFSDDVEHPESFTIDEPSRIVIDFAEVTNGLDKKTENINLGVTKSVSVVEAAGRTRAVINMSEKTSYSLERKSNLVIISINGDNQNRTVNGNKVSQIEDIDFKRGVKGEGQFIISLDGNYSQMDVYQKRNEVIVDLMDVTLPEKLRRQLDVVDFSTPIQTIKSDNQLGHAQFVLSMNGEFEHLAYQSENRIVIEVKPIKAESAQANQQDQFGYKGEKLSLNFQNIEVRSVLQLLADFTKLNLVTSDTVQGNLTLRLQNVPWDQALDIILKTKGLAMRQNGNVMLVAPAAEIAAQEAQELQAKKQLIELEPLYSEVFEINFAKASELETLLTNDGDDSSGSSESNSDGFLSPRGSVTVDVRTNSLLIRDTAKQLEEIRKLISQLDVPVRQVLIESRIVIASNNFAKDLGVRFGYTAANNTRSGLVDSQITSGTLGGTYAVLNGEDLVTTDTLNVDMPVVDAAGSIALSLTKLGGGFLDLELSAMQEEGQGEIISSPRVITSNQQEAVIEQGTEIPYQEASSSGATSVSFKSATLKLGVTPQITPDDHIIMELEVSKDEVGGIYNGVPSIDTRSVVTQVLVENGETVVLGGIYEQRNIDGTTKVPFFGDLPYVGFLFKSSTKTDDKSELLVFVTPKIIKENIKF